ncbi:glycosyltransferase [Curtobacterium aetherium]|uniref:Glycosyltransferase n=1 Tax=Curtobacterium aetherium TaxID=2841594 RepID=A0ACD1E816_9MICO|nr:glycosyltransferase [Curtobacterium sp. L6-1]QWS34954.1 glycosyltransferase [Curtobacterium sp. L6-1]
MRIAFTANPLPGHIVPMIPLVRAALAAGHGVAVVTGADAAPFVLAEGSPDVEVLAAGPPTLEAMADMQRETGTSPATAPRPDVIAEYFAGRRVTATVDDAIRAARAWRPHLVVSESLDHVGPYVAAALDVPFLRHSFGPERPEAVRTAMAAVSARTAADRGVVLPPVAAWIDVYPAFLEAPGTVREGRRIPIRPAAHDAVGRDGAASPADRRRRAVSPASASGPGSVRPRALVTMGTVFTSQPLLDRVLASIEEAGLQVDLVTTAVNGVRAEPTRHDSAVRIRNVPFRPLAELLAEVDAVVTVGGAGTVLGALAAGVPAVVMPLGADHAVNAARAEAAGAAVTVDGPEAVGAGLRRVLEDGDLGRSARVVAARIRELPPVEAALTEIEDLVVSATRERV